MRGYILAYPGEFIQSTKLLFLISEYCLQYYQILVTYDCQTFSLTLNNLRVFENRVLSRISGLKTDE
jgi:hypothetical protein